MLIYEGNLHKKYGAISELGAEKITFPPKPDGQADRRTDICFYRVASLLKSIQHAITHHLMGYTLFFKGAYSNVLVSAILGNFVAIQGYLNVL